MLREGCDKFKRLLINATFSSPVIGFPRNLTALSELRNGIPWRPGLFSQMLVRLILKIREGGRVVDCAVPMSVDVGGDGKRSVLGYSASLSEAEVHLPGFLETLVARGMHGVRLVTSDDHAELCATLRAVLAPKPWQRCQFHPQ